MKTEKRVDGLRLPYVQPEATVVEATIESEILTVSGGKYNAFEDGGNLFG